ncbi:MAG: glycosyltransferase family 4 protein [Gammaproteobacteria bacterium]|nr:glycosyltransferase family 4 protein [Gammaproteobacteria bacterium]
MKILFVQPTGDKRGHYGLWTSQICQAIAEHGEELCLLTNKIYPEKYLSEPLKFKIIELNEGKYRFDVFDQMKIPLNPPFPKGEIFLHQSSPFEKGNSTKASSSCKNEGLKGSDKEQNFTKIPPTSLFQREKIETQKASPFEKGDSRKLSPFGKGGLRGILINNPLYYWYGYFRNTFLIVKAALKLCQKEKFDILYLTDVEYLTATILLKLFSKNLPPVIWHVQAANFSYDSYVGSRIKKLYKIFQRRIFKSVLGKQVKAFAVLGAFHQNALRRQLDLPDKFPIEVVPDGADTIVRTLSQHEARKKISVETDMPVFLFFGMLRKDKGIEYLIEAVSVIARKRSVLTKQSSFLKTGSPRLNASQPRDVANFKVLIVGAPFEWSRDELQDLIDKFQVSDYIELRLNYIPDEEVQYYYTASDIVVFPYHESYTGGCGPLTKGACAYHKPVIAADVSDLGNMVSQNQIGWVVPPADPKALSLAMRAFLDLSNDAKNNMIENSQKCAKEHAWPMVGKKFLNLVNTVAGASYVN